MGDWSGTVPTILAGDTPTGDDWKNVLDELTALSVAWTAYTPTLTSSGGGASIGNGTLTGNYVRIGKTVTLRVQLIRGSTTSFGTGFVSFALPVTALAVNQVGAASLIDSGTVSYPAACNIDSGSPTILVPVASGGVITATSPFTWATDDQIRMFITYETP